MRFSRENTVAALAALMLVFTGWAWGGVVLWTQFATCAVGALALIAALMPRDRASPLMGGVRKGYIASLLLGLLSTVLIVGLDCMYLSEQRASTLELIPDAQLPVIDYVNLCLPGLGIGFGIFVAGMFASVLSATTHARSSLLRFPPFWIGVVLFGFITIQSLNPWGLVVERDLTWKIVPQDHIGWLPSGLAAPFVGDDDPGGMNGWRQMLILSGPWMLLCALRIAAWRRRILSRLTWVVGLNALLIGVVGHVVASGRDFEFLGFRPWFAHKAPYGPFIYRNHAGVYLYLAAGLVLALTAHLIARKGDRADRGGPHLLGGFLFIALCLLAVGTMSVGAAIGAGAMLLASIALYFVDRHVRTALSPAPAVMILACGLLLGYALADSVKLDVYLKRISTKQEQLMRTGADDRAPIRRAACAQLADGDAAKVVFGWGAGSYRWTSPVYFARQPEFLDTHGRLWVRANFAHCDWLQALLEWGVVGCLLLAAAVGWLALKIRNAWRRRSASLLALSVALVLVLLHASLDFIFYFTPVLTLLALIVAWLASAEDADAPESAH